MRKFKVHLDSGANAYSTYETEVTLDDLALNSDEWDAMTEDQKDEQMREVAFEMSDWGYIELGDET